MKTSYKRGFAPLLIVIAIAVAAAIGGGVYYSKSKNAAPVPEQKTSMEDSMSGGSMKSNGGIKASSSTTLSAGAMASSSISLKSFLEFKGSQKCTVNSATSNSQVAGTVYIHDGLLRGDFTATVNGKAMDSHMLRVKDSIYVWSGNQGAKMAVTSLEGLEASSMNKQQVSLDQKVTYKCETWTANDSQFNVPTGISFVDVAAMMKAYVR